MLRSMYSGVSGMQNHQTKMDVVGNNISNINTTGFKKDRVTFSEMISQTLQTANAPENNRGGINPQQIGLGVGIGSIDTNHSQGNIETTGINTDLAVRGNGYLVLNDGGQNLYTRDGNLSLDSNGELVNASSGYKLQGWSADTDGNVRNDRAIGDIRIPIGDRINAEATTEVTFSGNLDSRIEEGVARTGSIDVFDSLGKSHTVNLDFIRDIGTNLTGVSEEGISFTQTSFDPSMEGISINFAHEEGAELDVNYDTDTRQINIVGDLDNVSRKGIEEEVNRVLNQNSYTGSLKLNPGENGISANVDQETLTLGKPLFGDDTTLNINQDIENYDNALHDLEISFVEEDGPVTGNYISDEHRLVLSGEWADIDSEELQEIINETLLESGFEGQITAEIDGDNLEVGDEGVTIMLSASNNWNWKLADITDIKDDTSGGYGTIAFDTNGQIRADETRVEEQIKFDPREPGAPVQTINPIFDTPNMSITQQAAGFSVDGVDADGFEAGELDSFTIAENGQVNGQYSNGITRTIGQVALANFNNPGGLEKQGNTMFSQSENSGSAQIGVAGSGGRGTFASGSLEMSNVDLAQEFTEMIITQRGFQSNSSLITTSDEILQELVNLKR